MPYEILDRHVPEQLVLGIRKQLPMSALPAFLGESFGRLYTAVPSLGAHPLGMPFVLYHEFGPDLIDVEACVPVDRTVEPGAPVRAFTLPAADVAMTTHVGPYEGLAEAYAALSAWIADHGYRSAGPVRERYLNGPSDGTPPSEYRTEIEMPIEVVAAGAEAQLVTA
jgi:effector-binding domain-containing protein